LWPTGCEISLPESHKAGALWPHPAPYGDEIRVARPQSRLPELARVPIAAAKDAHAPRRFWSPNFSL